MLAVTQMKKRNNSDEAVCRDSEMSVSSKNTHRVVARKGKKIHATTILELPTSTNDDLRTLQILT